MIQVSTIRFLFECPPAALPESKIGETLHSSHWVLDASHHNLSWPLQAAKGSWRNRNQDAKGKA
jgi:hypothetical protein